MTTIACPLCAGPVALKGRSPACLIGHEFDADGLAEQVSARAEHALWAAVRSLEDQASAARWRQTRPSPPPHLDASIELAEQQAGLLRDLLRAREGATSDTDHKPPDW